MTKQPPGSRCAAALRKQATCASCVVRFSIVLKTRYAREKVPSIVVVAKSPMATGMASPPGLARSRATMARDRSMPCTSTPRRASGSAIRPVPMPNSSARPPPASPASTSATVSVKAGSNMPSDESS